MPNSPATFRNQHQRNAKDYRPSASQRGYDRRWRNYRMVFLATNPLCAECERGGRVTAATVVDHIRPHRGDYELFWSADNHQALCRCCHNRKTGAGG